MVAMFGDVELFDVLRLVVGFVILFYASYTDIKTRRASNILWVIMGVVGVIILVVQYFTVSNVGYAPIADCFFLFGKTMVYISIQLCISKRDSCL